MVGRIPYLAHDWCRGSIDERCWQIQRNCHGTAATPSTCRPTHGMQKQIRAETPALAFWGLVHAISRADLRAALPHVKSPCLQLFCRCEACRSLLGGQPSILSFPQRTAPLQHVSKTTTSTSLLWAIQFALNSCRFGLCAQTFLRFTRVSSTQRPPHSATVCLRKAVAVPKLPQRTHWGVHLSTTRSALATRSVRQQPHKSECHGTQQSWGCSGSHQNARAHPFVIVQDWFQHG